MKNTWVWEAITIDCASLQYWYNEFNYMFFGNSLRPALIKWYPEYAGMNIEAFAHPDLNPPVIRIFIDTEDHSLNEYILTVLLHEMVHLYCYENGIADIDKDGKHSDEFRKVAYSHGLIIGGYELSDEAHEAISQKIEQCFITTGLVDKASRLLYEESE